MLQERKRHSDSSLHIFYKWNATNMATVLAFIMEYPVTTLVIAVFAGLSALPIVLFISFVIYSLLFTLLGFAMVEVTFLMIAFSLLSAVIVFLFFVSLSITALLALTWTSATIGYSLTEKFQWIVHYFFPHFNFGAASSNNKKISRIKPVSNMH